jgi:hypothetical protein
MAKYDMKFKPKLQSTIPQGALPYREEMDPYREHPNLLYNMYRKEPNFLQNIQGGIDSLRESTKGMPKSLFDLFINRKMGFNIGDKGYLNLRFPEGTSQEEYDESGLGLNFTYDF